jgi:SAM-dependent methyltransferase
MNPERLSGVLNLGCGEKHIPGAVNVDCDAAAGPDVLHDLDQRPWPFPDDAFADVRANDVLEHLDSVLSAMEEIHRVCRNGAIVRITVPHYSSPNAFADVTHRHLFSWFSFHSFAQEPGYRRLTACRFRRVATQLIFHPSPLNRAIRRLANRFPDRYERRWAWMFPAWFLYFELQVVKE